MIWSILSIIAFITSLVYVTVMTRKIKQQRLKESIRKRELENYYISILTNFQDDEEE